ncbi:seed linoleate 9S-lipoxygenase-3-like [Arachis stenosperma]|uniref:seed linoleate 9S-lipoxygenase-3-like n=1 Tax=Arachis stenosperma TaxID=217475 RepID=UPI0025AD966F|nr:seed linoleate 9S-lipoxygenase-3-like [Arachis stenosperma]
MNIFGAKITGTVVLMQKNVLDVNSITSPQGILDTGLGGLTSLVDTLTSFLGFSVAFQLISATKPDSSGKGKVGNTAYLKGIIDNLPTLGDKQNAFKIEFDYDSNFGIPGAFYIKNYMSNEFLLLSLTLEGIPNVGTIHFVCNSWIYNAKNYQSDRIFFANNTYLPSKTPGPLVYYRDLELKNLRGNGTGERKEWERIYDYDVYNDLGDPDKGVQYARPVLGGSSTYPYPRRGRTGRKPTKTDPNTESRSDNFYIPRDEAFGHLKSSDFLAYGIKSISQDVIPALKSVFDINFTPNEFDSFEEVHDLYEGGIKLPTDVIKQITPLPVVNELLRTDGEQFLKFPVPKVVQVSKSAWMTDVEFAREILAGVNPGLIRCLQEFPPKSKLDSGVYGDHTSTITKEQIEPNLDGLTIDEAIQQKKVFILDDHDAIFPYLRRINSTNSKAYATRTILYLKSDGTLKPLAIELSLPHPEGDQYGAISKVYLPAIEGVQSYIWLLAKAYVIVNDSNIHQLISHWLNTHAVVEPFVIATNRQLSVLHPIYKLLFPHYRDTMNINALARNQLINAGGIIEQTFLPSKYAMEISSVIYKDWVFTDQALPSDLIKRGMAIADASSPNGVRLVIEDYPYAMDGLEIWGAISTWVQDYVSLYYTSDDTVKGDLELQQWWKELVEVGHGDKKDEPWWPKMQTLQDLIQTCTTLIWTASALHASVNFGQYPYGGFILNRPTLSRRFMPEEGSPEYDELVTNPERAYLRTVTPKFQTLIDLSVIEILSRHASDEYYLGNRDSAEFWTSDVYALEAFKKFGNKLAEIEGILIQRNNDVSLRNRVGPVTMPYTLLYPTSEAGLTFRGIPNSISI